MDLGVCLVLDDDSQAVYFSRCYLTQHPGRILVPRVSGARKLSQCKEGMAHFLESGYKFSELYAYRGTSLISQETFVVQDLNCEQVSVSECKIWRDLSWEQGSALTMTSP